MSLEDDISRYLNDSDKFLKQVFPDDPDVKVLAAGLERDYYLVKLADLPDVTQRHGFLHVDGAIGVCATNASQSQRETALRELSLAVALQSRESEAAALDARRDELARELCSVDYRYVNPRSKDFINERIGFEDRAAAAEAEVAKLRGEHS